MTPDLWLIIFLLAVAILGSYAVRWHDRYGTRVTLRDDAMREQLIRRDVARMVKGTSEPRPTWTDQRYR